MIRGAGAAQLGLHKPLRPLHGFEIKSYAALPENRRIIGISSIAASVHSTTTLSRPGPRRRRQLALVSRAGEAEDAGEVRGELLNVDGVVAVATSGRPMVHDDVSDANVRQDLGRQQPVEVVQL